MGKVKVASADATTRLISALDNRRFASVAKPTKIQVAMVLHALADHTAIISMLEHRPDNTSPWPQATSIGRWLHDVGYELEDEVFIEKQHQLKYFHNHVCSTCSIDGVNPGAGCINCRKTGYNQTPCPNCPGPTKP